ncbi:hypothetical protein RB594_005591 [Gaeumannomyces avenae]
MTSTGQCLASLARLSLTTTIRPAATTVPRFLAPTATQVRFASPSKKPEKKKRQHKTFRVWRKDSLITFSLCDAMRYIRAFEVGKPADNVAYDLAVKLTSLKRTAIIRNRIRLPHTLATNVKIAVICKPGSRASAEARMAGAAAVGEETIFEAVRDGSMDFNKLVCHVDSLPALTAANLGRILGPKGMMPSAKTGTVAKDVKSMMREMIGASDYREKEGVVRMPIGKLSFTPEMLADNVKAFIAQLKKDMSALEDQTDKGIDEIVLSASHSPGFSLSGGFNPSDPTVTATALSTPM